MQTFDETDAAGDFVRTHTADTYAAAQQMRAELHAAGITSTEPRPAWHFYDDHGAGIALPSNDPRAGACPIFGHDLGGYMWGAVSPAYRAGLREITEREAERRFPGLVEYVRDDEPI